MLLSHDTVQNLHIFLTPSPGIPTTTRRRAQTTVETRKRLVPIPAFRAIATPMLKHMLSEPFDRRSF